MTQANHVADLLAAHGVATEVVSVSTDGDRWQGDLSALGGKGAFVRQLDQAQLDGDVDLAVHCLKDIPGDIPLPDGLVIAAHLPRDDVRDAVVSRHGGGLGDLPAGAVVGTSSVRRRAQLGQHWPRLHIEPIRGNADTRLAKLDNGQVDAVILAVAGLQRIGAADRITAILPVDQMLPAIGAGVVVITARRSDQHAVEIATRLDHPATRQAATAERTMLRQLSGHCHSPIAGLATIERDGRLRLQAAVYSPDGATSLQVTEWGAEPAELGHSVADALLAKGARELIDSIDR